MEEEAPAARPSTWVVHVGTASITKHGTFSTEHGVEAVPSLANLACIPGDVTSYSVRVFRQGIAPGLDDPSNKTGCRVIFSMPPASDRNAAYTLLKKVSDTTQGWPSTHIGFVLQVSGAKGTSIEVWSSTGKGLQLWSNTFKDATLSDATRVKTQMNQGQALFSQMSRNLRSSSSGTATFAKSPLERGKRDAPDEEDPTPSGMPARTGQGDGANCGAPASKQPRKTFSFQNRLRQPFAV